MKKTTTKTNKTTTTKTNKTNKSKKEEEKVQVNEQVTNIIIPFVKEKRNEIENICSTYNKEEGLSKENWEYFKNITLELKKKTSYIDIKDDYKRLNKYKTINCVWENNRINCLKYHLDKKIDDDYFYYTMMRHIVLLLNETSK